MWNDDILRCTRRAAWNSSTRAHAESGKATLKASLAQELARVLARRPDLLVVTTADGANDNWTFLSGPPQGRAGYQIVDFFHAADHLADTMVVVHGEGTVKFNVELKKYRHLLRHDTDGVEKVIRHLRYLAGKHPRSHKLSNALWYLRISEHREREDRSIVNGQIGPS